MTGFTSGASILSNEEEKWGRAREHKSQRECESKREVESYPASSLYPDIGMFADSYFAPLY